MLVPPEALMRAGLSPHLPIIAWSIVGAAEGAADFFTVSHPRIRKERIVAKRIAFIVFICFLRYGFFSRSLEALLKGSVLCLFCCFLVGDVICLFAFARIFSWDRAWLSAKT